MNLPKLYKSTKTGATQVCDISHEDNTFTVTFGQLDGKMQSKQTTCEGKNIGRANETTPAQQAASEAQSKWDKKVKSGYTTDSSAPVAVQLPQKVKAYVGNENKIVFPAYSTFKLNGINGTYWLQEDGSLKLTSRGGEVYPPIPHQEDSVRFVMQSLKVNSINGELYIHGEHLQDITSAVRKPKELSKQLTFKFFEFPDYEVTGEGLKYVREPYTSKSFKFKANWLSLLRFRDHPGTGEVDPYAYAFDQDRYVEPVQIKLVKNVEELEAHYQQAIDEGYEGTVIYNLTSEYKFNERSSSVYKYKKTQDAEFQVIGYEFDKNNHAVYTCKTGTETGTFFKVKRKGTNDERLKDAEQAAQNLDKWLTVEFEMYSKDLKPLKPVGLSFRDCDIQGDPLE